MHPTVTRTVVTRLPIEHGLFQLYHFLDVTDGKEHLALVHGEVSHQSDVLVRVHSECFTGDVLGSQRCDCGPQLHLALQQIAIEGCGVLIYLRQEGRGIGLAEKLRAYNLQDQGYDTVDANLMLGHQADERDYSAAAAILADLGLCSIRLLTNNPAKISGLQQLGITVNQRVAVETGVHTENQGYLRTKVERMSHLLSLPLHQGSASINGNRPPLPQSRSSAQPVSPPTAIDEQLEHLKTHIVNGASCQRRPFVTLSYAQSIDGSIAGEPGKPLRLSGSESMTVTHQLRTLHQAILVGVNTVLSDNPRLNARLAPGPSPIPVILDCHLRTPPDAALFSHHPQVIIATHFQEAKAEQKALTPAKASLIARGATVIEVPPSASGRISLEHLLDQLVAMGITSLMVEGGASVITSFLSQGLADFGVITIAPIFVGGVRAIEQCSCVAAGADGNIALPTIAQPTYTQAGQDLLLWGHLGEPEP